MLLASIERSNVIDFYHTQLNITAPCELMLEPLTCGTLELSNLALVRDQYHPMSDGYGLARFPVLERLLVFSIFDLFVLQFSLSLVLLFCF